jgi:hypothetical protein
MGPFFKLLGWEFKGFVRFASHATPKSQNTPLSAVPLDYFEGRADKVPSKKPEYPLLAQSGHSSKARRSR